MSDKNNKIEVDRPQYAEQKSDRIHRERTAQQSDTKKNMEEDGKGAGFSSI